METVASSKDGRFGTSRLRISFKGKIYTDENDRNGLTSKTVFAWVKEKNCIFSVAK